MVSTASSLEFRLAAASCCKLHARIQDDTAAASRREKLHSRIHLDTAAASNTVKKAFATIIGEGELDAAAVSR